MGRSNTANGGSSYYDLDIEVTYADAGRYDLRAVIYLTSLNVNDSTNNLAVSGHFSRSGARALSGAYNHTEVWSQTISVTRTSVDQIYSANASWSAVDYWGTTLSASVAYTVPALAPQGGPPYQVAAGADQITSSSARVFATFATDPSNGGFIDYVEFSVSRAADGFWHGSRTGGWTGVTYTGLLPGTAYDAISRAHNQYGNGVWSAPHRFTTLAAVPGAPTIAIGAVTATTVEAHVTTVPPANGSPITLYTYRIYRTSDNALVQTIPGSAAGVTFTGLTRTTAYYVNCYATNSIGNGPTSANVSATTLPSVPGPPTITSVSSISPTSAVVSWSPPADNGGQTITAYDVQYSTDNFATGPIQSTGNLTGLTPGTVYQVRVRAKNASGDGAWSAPVSFTTLTGIRVYTGSAWVDAPIYAWNGTAWVACEVRIFNGTAWVPTG